MASLRALAQCLALPASFSLVNDFFGHQNLAFMNAMPPSQRVCSVRAQIALLKGPHIHLNMIKVGDGLPQGWLDFAVFAIRRIYAQVGFGVGRVLWYLVAASEANGYDVIDSDDEACDLTNSWTVANNGLDVFVVANGWTEDERLRVGISPMPGTCDKDNAWRTTGCVISVQSFMTGLVMAHEIGHYLGLEHVDGLELEDIDEPEEQTDLTAEQISNLMFPAANTAAATIRSQQGNTMKDHCFVQPGC